MFCDRFTIEGEVFVYDEVLPGVFGDVLGADFELNRGGAVCFFWSEGGGGGDSGFFASGGGADFTFQRVLQPRFEAFVGDGVDHSATGKRQDLLVRTIDGNCCANRRFNWNHGRVSARENTCERVVVNFAGASRRDVLSEPLPRSEERRVGKGRRAPSRAREQRDRQ